MYTVLFYTFSKKQNSTAQVTSDSFKYQANCEITDGSTINAPTIKLKLDFAPYNYNYAHINSWSRSYFITEWSYNVGFWFATLSEDVLATHKAQIGETSAYINRSSAEFNGRITDPLAVTQTGCSFAQTTNTVNPFPYNITDGWFVVGIINSASTTIGSVSYYVFTNAQFRAFAAKLFGDADYLGNVTDISEGLTKILYDPFQYVASCMWCPLQPPTSGTVTSIPFGWWNITASASILSSYTVSSVTATAQVPKHPQALTRGYYLLKEPYSSYYLDFAPFGAFSIPAEILTDTDYISMSIMQDCITGVGTLRLETTSNFYSNNGITNIIKSQIGVPVTLSQAAPNVFDASTQLVYGEDAMEGVKGFKWAENAINTLTGIGMGLMSKLSPTQTINNNGDYTAGYTPIRLTGTFRMLIDDDNANTGRPLGAIRKIKDIPGFVLCASPVFQSEIASETEINEINRYLTTGFYYE